MHEARRAPLWRGECPRCRRSSAGLLNKALIVYDLVRKVARIHARSNIRTKYSSKIPQIGMTIREKVRSSMFFARNCSLMAAKLVIRDLLILSCDNNHVVNSEHPLLT